MKRIRLLDVLRGLAIIGTLGINIWIFSLMDGLGGFSENGGLVYLESMDTFIYTFFIFLFNGKFLGLLTILFGAGLELKRQKNLEVDRKWLGVYVWSCVLLFIDGLLHFLFVFEADILMSYALTAIVVAVILEKGSNIVKWVGWILGILHGLVVLVISLGFGLLLRFEEAQEMMTRVVQRMSNETTDIFLYGGYWDQVAYRISHFFELRMEAITIIPFNICLFLIGVWLVRSGYFAQTDHGRKKRMKLLKWGMGIGIPLNGIIFTPLAEFNVVADRYLFAPIMSLGYIGLVSYLFDKYSTSLMIHALEKVGRVALSCYILQNVLASVIFYGWGFGLGAYNNVWIVIAAWLFISVLLILFSFIWLRFYRQGPFEYIWRSTANFKLKKS
ncbi:DUF418 domain-containing protein [Oceanobacillus jeddahense]|uniref:DUF418 domain-containing protein n=1 Tax=Oceanobacillus jeddahense TaxID=1462527 RepID=UPI000595FA5F|nr:DUF418 domain-containing protein [Oceanobacillus jeddahense]